MCGPRCAGLDVRDGVGDVVEGGVPVDLVAAGREERVLLVRAGRGDVGRRHDPDADALVAPGVQVAGVMQGHLRVGGVQGADVHVVEAALAAQEDLIKGPVRPYGCCCHAGTPSWRAAYAGAAAPAQGAPSWGG